MNSFEIMATVSCVTSAVTMIAVFIAALPYIRKGMEVVRDLVLWGVFGLVLAVLIAIASKHVSQRFAESEPRVDSPSQIYADSRYAGK